MNFPKQEFYQYKPLLQLEHFEQLLNYIKNKVWFSRVSDLNDPFERNFKFKLPHIENIDSYNEYYTMMQNQIPTLTKEKYDEDMKSLDFREKFEGTTISNQFRDHGILSLTKSPSNIPMWAHYANNHMGYCLIYEIDFQKIYEQMKAAYQKPDLERPYSEDEFQVLLDNILNPSTINSQDILSFRIAIEDPDKRFIFGKVSYQDCIPSMNTLDLIKLKRDYYSSAQYLFKNSFGVKYKQWSYEKEYRLLVNANSKECGLMDLKILPFIKITGLILGQNIGKNLNKDASDFISHASLNGFNFKGNTMEERVREYITHKAEEHSIKIKTARCSSEKYEIIIEN